MRAIFRRDSTTTSSHGDERPRSPATPVFGGSTNSINFDSLSECIDLFLGNEFASSLAFCSQQERTSIYHAFAKSVLCFINASTAYHKTEIEASTSALESCLKMCYANKRRGSILNIITHVLSRGNNYDDYTDLEIHTELISAETRLMIVLLELMRSEQSVSAFLKRTSDHMKYCVNSFKICLEMLTSRKDWESGPSQQHFKSGLYLSIGIFNVVLAILPDKIQKVMREIGCYGDRELGISYLMQAVDVHGVQRKIACLATIVMDFLIEKTALHEVAVSCLKELQESHPKSAFLSFLTGKSKISQRHLTKGNEALRESLNSQTEWIELQTACMINLMWSNALLLDYDKAIFYAVKLTEVNIWYPEVHYYILASFLFMKEISESSKSESTPDFLICSESKDYIDDCMKKVKGLKKYQRDEMTEMQILSLRAANSCLDDGKDMLLPAIELMFYTNQLKNMPIEKLVHVIELIERRFNKIVSDQELMSEIDEPVGPYLDDYCTMKLLRGVCYKHLSKIKPAIENLKEVIERKNRIKNENLVGFAMMELGMLMCDNSQVLEGRFWLKTVKEEHPGILRDMHRQIKIDTYLRYTIPETEDEFMAPGVSIRRPSAADVQVKVVKKLVRRRSSSIGFDHSSEFDSSPPVLASRTMSFNKDE